MNAMMDQFGGKSLAVILGMALVVTALPAPELALAAGKTFVVNTDADSDDKCDELSVGYCSLREAIKEANANDGVDQIHFAIPVEGDGTVSIRPNKELPTITDPVIINGYTQPGAQPNTAAEGTNAVVRIELSGKLGIETGLRVEGGGGTTIRGLAINDFSEIGLLVEEGSDFGEIRIEGNIIGATAGGTVPAPNGLFGLAVATAMSDTIVGGESPAARNLISGNTVYGVGLASANVIVAGNLIGTDRTGSRPLGNGGEGIFIFGSNNTVARNVIAFNGRAGLGVYENVTGNRIDRNAIFGNGTIGIDLGLDGPTPNDPGDGDTGYNNIQNFPALATAAAQESGVTTIVGTLDSQPNRQYLIQFFANPRATDAEGQTYLGQQQVGSDQNGDAGFTYTVGRDLSGQAITATATVVTPGAPADTSELSPPITVAKAAPSESGKPCQSKKGKKGKHGKKRKKKKCTVRFASGAASAQSGPTETSASLTQPATGASGDGVQEGSPRYAMADGKRQEDSKDRRGDGSRDRDSNGQDRHRNQKRADRQPSANGPRGEVRDGQK